ncbi:MAG: hypothetical protein RLZZ336_1148 [Cyanobacteriota bacterium]|jgi:hypothetical protein
MAADPLDKLRLRLMQDLLPVGVAVVERARKGGLKDVVAGFSAAEAGTDPLSKLRQEGEPLASQLRDGLDRVSPGLGNPVMKVDVRVEQTPPDASPHEPPLQALPDEAALLARLQAMEQRLVQLEARLERPA